MSGTRALAPYVYDVAVQCRSCRAFDGPRWHGDGSADLAELTRAARRHAADYGHEVEVVVGTVRAYGPVAK